ncbi:MAG: hypothetical protein AB4058_21495 [Microcystaceae cyanobacterium]
MSKYSYYRNQGYSTGEMLSEGKLDIMDLPERVPLRFREKEEFEEEPSKTREEVQAYLNSLPIEPEQSDHRSPEDDDYEF